MLTKHSWWQIIVAVTVKTHRRARLIFDISSVFPYHLLRAPINVVPGRTALFVLTDGVFQIMGEGRRCPRSFLQ